MVGTQPHITDKMPSTKHTHAHTLSHAYTLTNMGIHKHAHVCVLTHMLVHSYAHVHNACIYTGSCNMHVYMLMCSHNTLRYTPFHMHICIHTDRQTHAHSHMHTWPHIHTYSHRQNVHIYLYTCSLTCAHAHTHSHQQTYSLTYVHMYVHAHTFTHSYSLHTLPLSPRKQKKPFRAGVTNLCLVGLDLIVDKHYHAGGWALLGAPLNFFL